jgi:hypothetical protein
MDNTAKTDGPTRGMTRRRWIVLAVGGYLLSIQIYVLVWFAWTMLRLPGSWSVQGPEDLSLFGVSIPLATLVMGKLLHVRGRRQWALAFALIVTAFYLIVFVLP